MDRKKDKRDVQETDALDKAIIIKQLSHKFGEKEVLKNISFDVKRGEVFGLLGPSGAGKTTLIHILTGQLKATGGESKIMGTSSCAMTGEEYKKIGIMMDHFGLYERMTCYDNLKFYQMIDGKGTKEIDNVLKMVGLLEAKKRPVMNLSKGMKNRLAFARAVLRKPGILFLDEPTSGLDPATVEEIHKMIQAEKERGTTIFLTTHNMYEAEKLCDRVALLNEGVIVELGAPADICRKYNHQKKIILHLKDGQDVELMHGAESGKRIKDYLEKGEVETIHSTEPNLETIFVELTGRKFEVC